MEDSSDSSGSSYGEDLAAVLHGPSASHTHSVIILHDHKSNSQLLCEMLRAALHPVESSELFPRVRFIIPDGPLDAFDDTDLSLRTWFYMDELQEYDCWATTQQWAELGETVFSLDVLVDQEAARVGYENIFVGGHGMGCAVGLAMLLQAEKAIGGFFGLGGFMPWVDDVKKVAFEGKTIEADRRRMQQGQVNAETGAMGTEAEPSRPNTNGVCLQAGTGNHATGQPPERLRQGSEDRLQRVVDFMRSFTYELPEAYPETMAVDTPVILVHAPDDAEIPLSHSKDALRMLQILGFKVKLVRPGEDEHTVTQNLLEGLLVEVLNRQIGSWDLRNSIVESFQNNPRY